MDVPHGSHTPSPAKPGRKATDAQRRNRRTYVENLVIDGRRDGWIGVHVAQKFGISTRMVRKDLRLIRARWAREDNAFLDEQRKRQVKALERIARKAERSRDLAQARLARRDIAHLLGMGADLTVRMAGKVTVVHKISDPGTWVPQFVEGAVEVGMLTAGQVVTVDTQVKPESGGSAQDGGEHG